MHIYAGGLGVSSERGRLSGTARLRAEGWRFFRPPRRKNTTPRLDRWPTDYAFTPEGPLLAPPAQRRARRSLGKPPGRPFQRAMRDGGTHRSGGLALPLYPLPERLHRTFPRKICRKNCRFLSGKRDFPGAKPSLFSRRKCVYFRQKCRRSGYFCTDFALFLLFGKGPFCGQKAYIKRRFCRFFKYTNLVIFVQYIQYKKQNKCSYHLIVYYDE